MSASTAVPQSYGPSPSDAETFSHASVREVALASCVKPLQEGDLQSAIVWRFGWAIRDYTQFNSSTLSSLQFSPAPVWTLSIANSDISGQDCVLFIFLSFLAHTHRSFDVGNPTPR